jgi:hypothetical protein
MPRIFELVRHADVSGVSGTGVVAEGCVFTDGSVALRWRGENPATAVWPDLDSVLAVHGHHGATEVNWLDLLDRSAFRAPILPNPPTPPARPPRPEALADPVADPILEQPVVEQPEWAAAAWTDSGWAEAAPAESGQPGPSGPGHHRGDDVWGDLLTGRTNHGFRPSTPAGSFGAEPAPRARGRHFRS